VKKRPLAERMLDVPQRLLERALSGEMQIAATGTVRFLKQIIRSRALKKEMKRED
jgi:hypothetical protein